MIRGSCLCGGVQFEIERTAGPFELYHCTRCRKVSESPPPYDTSVCVRCGSLLPNPSKTGDPVFEIPAGALDDDPLVRPDKHIYVEFKAPWEQIADDLPQMTKSCIRASRTSSP